MGGRSVRQNGALEGVGVVYLETPSIGGTRPHDPVGEGTPCSVAARWPSFLVACVAVYRGVIVYRDVGVAIYWIVHDRLSFGCWVLGWLPRRMWLPRRIGTGVRVLACAGCHGRFRGCRVGGLWMAQKIDCFYGLAQFSRAARLSAD